MTPPLIKRYLVALDRHKWAGLAGFVVVMGMSTAAALQPKPPANYVSSGALGYSSAPVTLSQTGAALQQQGQTLTPEFLLSDQVVNSVAQKLSLDPAVVRRHASVNVNSRPAAGTARAQRARDAAPTGFRVGVNYEDRKKEQAEQATTELMNAMVEQSRLFNTQQLTTMINNLGQLRSEIDQDLQQAEQNLEQYVRREKPSIQAAREGELVGAITNSEAQQRQLQLSLQGIDAQIRSLESRLGLSPAQAYTSAALSADPIIADLRAQIHNTESQIQVLQQDLRPEHPNMIQLHNQQQAYEQLLRTRVAEVIGGNQIAAPLSTDSQLRQGISLDPARQELANTLVSLQTQRDTLQQQLTTLTQLDRQMRQQYSTLPPDRRIQQARLQQQVSLKQAFYDQIQQRLEDARLAEKETVGSLVVSQPPQTELSVVDGPSSIVILMVGGLVGLLVGGGLVLLLDSLDAKFHTLQDVQTALRQQEVPVLGLLPLLPLELESAGLPLVTPADSHYIEPYERFRSNLRRATGSKALKTILITSTVNGEGKTISAYNLAIASARAGKRTLLIEADLRSPSQAKSLKVALDPESSAEPLRYYGHLSDCIRLVPEIENLYLLPSPGVQRQASALLESSEMRRMLEDVRGRFDLVILDTPALSRCNDALLLEPYGDGLILVTRPGYTEEGLLTEAIEQFSESEDIQFLGAIINGADIPMQPAFYEETENYYNIVPPDLGSEDVEKVGITSSRL
jgi:capsular exopolysaccharide synthesis family protein